MKHLILFILLTPISMLSQDTIIQIKIPTKLRTNGDGIYELTEFIPDKGKRYKFTAYKNGLWKIVERDSLLGWIPSSCIYISPVLEKIAKNDKLEAMQNKYGGNEGYRITQGMVWVGMTREMLIDSQGYPLKNNVTRLREGIKSEQFVYKNQYVYLKNGVVEAIQN